MSIALARAFFINPDAWDDSVRLTGRVVLRSRDAADVLALMSDAGLTVEWSPTSLPGLHFCFAQRVPTDFAAIGRLRGSCDYLYPEVLDCATSYVATEVTAQKSASQLHHTYLKTAGAWATTKGGGVHVAVIDRSFDLCVWSLSDRFAFGRFRDAAGWTATSNPANFPPPISDHGTTCAAIAVGAAAPDWGSGVAPEASFVPLAVGTDVTSTKIAESLLWLLEPAIRPAALVVSCSITPLANAFGKITLERALQEVLSKFETDGIPISWAVSNNKFTKVPDDEPASHPAVVSVGSLNKNRVTNGAVPPDVYAIVGGSEVVLSNAVAASSSRLPNVSSYASPVAAGVAALALAKNGARTASEIYALMTKHASTNGTISWLNADAVVTNA